MRFFLLLENRIVIGRDGGFSSKEGAEQVARMYHREKGGLRPAVVDDTALPANAEFHLCEVECWTEPAAHAECGFSCVKK